MYGSVKAARASWGKLRARERRGVSGRIETPYGRARLLCFHLIGVAILGSWFSCFFCAYLPGQALVSGAHYSDRPPLVQPSQLKNNATRFCSRSCAIISQESRKQAISLF